MASSKPHMVRKPTFMVQRKRAACLVCTGCPGPVVLRASERGSLYENFQVLYNQRDEERKRKERREGGGRGREGGEEGSDVSPTTGTCPIVTGSLLRQRHPVPVAAKMWNPP